jgi:methylmalonyl-CoA mutase
MSLKNNFDFSEFLPISSEKWTAKIREELKINAGQSLAWQSDNVLTQPFYSQKDLEKLSYLDNFHSHFILKSPRHWYKREIISFKNSLDASSQAADALNNGADAIAYDIRNTTLTEEDLLQLVKNISLKFSPVHFITNTSPLPLVKIILKNQLHDLKGSIIYSPLSNWMEQKDWTTVSLNDLASSMLLLKDVPRYKTLTIDASFFHNKEAGLVQEIVSSISLALEYIDQITEQGISIYDVLTNFEFSFAIGKHYFMEIAKLRAFRLIWKKITEACDPTFDSLTTPLHCTTSAFYFSKEDAYKNILHNTTEAMAAIIGGCDSLSIVPFDATTNEKTSFSTRISRNISLILKDEAYFDKTTDPAAGSYYIENMTNELVEKAWEEIVAIEKQGGFVKAYTKK